MAPRPHLDIRRATADDAATIAAIVQRAYQGYIERLGKAPEPMRVDYEARVEGGDMFVAVEQGDILGILALSDTDAGFAIDNVAVDPLAQGRRIGRLLMAHAEAEARARGHDRITLYTHERMTENRNFYAQLGYSEVGAWRQRGYDRIFMEKPLVGTRSPQ